MLGIDLPSKVAKGKRLLTFRRYCDLLFVANYGPSDNEGNLLFAGQVGIALRACHTIKRSRSS